LIRCGAVDEQAALLERLPETLSACAETAAAQIARAAGKEQAAQTPALRECVADAFEVGRKRAEFFIKRNPSALAEAALADADPVKYRSRLATTAGPNAGQLYGTWWHEFVERLDWRAGVSAWDEVFAGAITASPDEKLSRSEWKKLRDLLTSGSELGRLLTAPGVITQAEMPFLWAMSERECLDGIIDLAVLDPARESWVILDWKTNRTTMEELAGLSEHYVPQLSAYWQAVGKMLGGKVSAGIYSTATGQWLPYGEEELARAWAKLRCNPEELERVLGEDRRRE
jgi:ATP-dependent exoDNAse (exonuclease V) beta subunit